LPRVRRIIPSSRQNSLAFSGGRPVAGLLAGALRQAGYEATHVAEIDLATATDRRIWDEAVTRSAILITKDKDFATQRAAVRVGPSILWIRMGNIGNRTLIAKLLQSLPRLRSAIERGGTIIEFVGR
jgi:predicted nuclease of predicted toxin-antitoxin system